jgi:chemotaxis protein CheX
MTEAIQPLAESAGVSLPAILDLQAAEPLRAELMALRGRPLNMDASQVARMGGLCLQVILAARQTWAADGVAIRVDQPSDAFIEQLGAFGNPGLQFEPEGGRT